MSSANIRSIPVIRDVKIALMKFMEEGRGAREVMLQEMLRAIDWVENDRPLYWEGQVRKAFDQVTASRTALNACQMRTVAGRHPSCIEEKQAHEKAKRRLQFCQDQLQKVKKWAAKIRHEADEFRGRMASLGRCLDGDFPKTVATLESMARTLESYAEIRPPGEELLADNAPPTSTAPTPPE